MEIPQIIHESWHKYLQPLFDDPKMTHLKNHFLPRCHFYPSPPNIFRVFKMPMEQIKVVCMGQDVYPNGEGIGLAFAVLRGTPTPPSLKVIRGEVEREQDVLDLPEGVPTTAAEWCELRHWANQGVFLLNSALTVEVGKANSHTDVWKWFTREIVHLLSTTVKPIWMLWGTKAQEYNSYIDGRHGYQTFEEILRIQPLENQQSEALKYNFVLRAYHPAAELYPGSTNKFTGCNHFFQANQILKARGFDEIKW